MLCVYVTEGLRWCVEYRLEGVGQNVKVSCVESSDLKVIQSEIENKLRLEMGLAKGKTFTIFNGKEL